MFLYVSSRLKENRSISYLSSDFSVFQPDITTKDMKIVQAIERMVPTLLNLRSFLRISAMITNLSELDRYEIAKAFHTAKYTDMLDIVSTECIVTSEHLPHHDEKVNVCLCV